MDGRSRMAGPKRRSASLRARSPDLWGNDGEGRCACCRLTVAVLEFHVLHRQGFPRESISGGILSVAHGFVERAQRIGYSVAFAWPFGGTGSRRSAGGFS